MLAFDRARREAEKTTGRIISVDSAGITRTDKRNLTFLKGLLLAVKRGDLLIVPAEGYRRDVLIGEVMDDPGSPIKVRASDGDNTHTYIGRAVTWRSRTEKRFFKRALLDKLHTPITFFAIGISLRDEIYQLAYGSYLYGGTYVATFDPTKEKFTSADNLVASLWFNGLAATRAAVESGEVNGRSFVEAAISPSASHPQNELEINIHSPGTVLVRSAGIFAFVLMAMSPLSAAQAQQVADGETRITLRAVGGANKNCAVEVEAAVADYVRSLGPQALLEACEIGERVRENATLKAKVQLKRVDKGAR